MTSFRLLRPHYGTIEGTIDPSVRPTVFLAPAIHVGVPNQSFEAPSAHSSKVPSAKMPSDFFWRYPSAHLIPVAPLRHDAVKVTRCALLGLSLALDDFLNTPLWSVTELQTKIQQNMTYSDGMWPSAATTGLAILFACDVAIYVCFLVLVELLQTSQ